MRALSQMESSERMRLSSAIPVSRVNIGALAFRGGGAELEPDVPATSGGPLGAGAVDDDDADPVEDAGAPPAPQTAADATEDPIEGASSAVANTSIDNAPLSLRTDRTSTANLR